VEAHIGSLAAVPALSRPDLLAAPVASALAALGDEAADGVGVAEIDPEVADTAAFCERYGSARRVGQLRGDLGKREGETRFAAW
jgi:hypothetical protein